VPLFIWAFLRVLKALAATAQLVASPRVLRRLPWPYIRTLPLRDRWLGLLTLTVPVTLAAAIVVAAGPTSGIRFAAWTVALCAGGLGIVSSWARALAHRSRRG
jgi:hypothetical protein